jgi:pimeloyl-ACP methyl ester carboxylesterase
MTPRSWEHWVPYYEAKGYRVITPAYPGFDIEVEALRENPDIIANLTVPETVGHLASVIAALDTPPFIIGHSFGGTLTQLLLARGLGSAGVVIDSAPTEGVRVSPPSQIRSFFPALKNPANIHKAVAFTAEEFHYAFANTLSAEDSRAAWERYAIAAPGHWVWVYGLIANFKPGHQETWVNYDQDRTPLLFIAGEKDHIMPPSVAAPRMASHVPMPQSGGLRTPRSPSTGRCRPGWVGVHRPGLVPAPVLGVRSGPVPGCRSPGGHSVRDQACPGTTGRAAGRARHRSYAAERA